MDSPQVNCSVIEMLTKDLTKKFKPSPLSHFKDRYLKLINCTFEQSCLPFNISQISQMMTICLQAVKAKIQQLDTQFDFVLLAEFFDESLVPWPSFSHPGNI